MMQQQEKLLPKAVAVAEELEEATDRRKKISSDDVDACPLRFHRGIQGTDEQTQPKFLRPKYYATFRRVHNSCVT
jgi:hypothetical protein